VSDRVAIGGSIGIDVCKALGIDPGMVQEIELFIGRQVTRPQRASQSFAEWNRLPWYRRWWAWVVSAW